MADFRKVFFVLVALTLLAGLASAQSQSPFQCTAVGANPPGLRGEGLTELVGDILISCTGGAPLAPGTQIPTANITVYMNATVTSRLLGTASVSGASEALLLIDDPGNPILGTYGSTVPQTICPNPLQGAGTNGCIEFVGNVGATMPTGFGGLSAADNLGVPVAGVATSGTPGANVFQGVVSGGSVTFYGVPIMPPVTSGNGGRTFRITNVRINANTLNAGGFVPTSAVAAIQVTGTAALNLLQSSVTVGYVSQSLNTFQYVAYSSSTTGFASSITLNQCQSYQTSSGKAQALETIRFQEAAGQGSAFKPRGNALQSTPGQNYYTESGLTPAATGLPAGATQSNGVTYSAGYADWGTRLKAVFSNVPSGVSLYVSVTNLNSSDNAPMYAAGTAPTTFSSFAELITGEISPDSAGNPATPGGAPNPGALPLVTQTGSTSASVGANVAAASVGYASIPVVNGSASAVWEVVNSLPNTPENFDFELFIVDTANVASSIPPAPSTMTVNLSYAPIPTQGAFTLSSGQSASSTLGIPRFADTSTAKTALTFQICQTALLFPFVMEVAGFDTGLAIANTSADPFGTSPQTGSCQVWWYGTTPPAVNPGYVGSAGYQTTIPTSSQLMAAGTVQGWATSATAPGFYGYVIAICNFQYAHGFAFVSDLGSQKLAMGYLADVLNTPIMLVPRGNAATSTSLPLPAGTEANGQ